jgi:hypothetical protein
MKKNSFFLFLFFILFLFSCAALFARGKTEEAEKKPINEEWILCVTKFDTGQLSEGKQNVGSVISRNLVDTLNVLSSRVRLSPEYAYYEGFAWAQSRSSAAKALVTKQEERSLLLYRGDSSWRYQQNLAKIDAEIEKLKENLAKIESDAPLIESEPKFSLAGGNNEGNFPDAPRAGDEYRFCQRQRADAFLAGSIQEYYGRYYVHLRLYTVYTRSFIYEDSIIFSPDDLVSSVDIMAEKLIAALSGSAPAALAVNASPKQTLVLINRSFAGRGNVPAVEHPPGRYIITMSADQYESETVEVNLKAGELVEINASLRASEFGHTEIFSSSLWANVYQGSMYVGEAPHTIRLPLNQLEYISVEGPRESAKAVFYTPSGPQEASSLSLRTRPTLPAGQKRVKKARDRYYWAWGGTWITGIAAWIMYGIYNNSSFGDDYFNRDFFDPGWKETYTAAHIGTLVGAGVAVTWEIIQMARYIYTSGEDAPPIVKTDTVRR